MIPSVPERGRQVQNRILDEVDKHHYKSDAVFAIKLAMEEVITNAIKHGNKFDQSKNVTIQATVGEAETEIIVEDEGPGFMREKVPDPTAPENLEKPSGRGLLLIESYMSSVDYSKNGRRIRMVRRND